MQIIIACVVALVVVGPHGSAQESCLSENDVASVALRSDYKNTQHDLYRGQQEFTIAMLDAIQKATPNENIFFSPYSTYHALLLAYFGARNETEKELVRALRLQWAKNRNEVYSGYRLEKRTRETRAKKMPLEFASADRIYFDKHIKLVECMTDIFIDELESVDFQQNSEQCRKNINGWIDDITRHEIPEMLSPGEVTSDTQLVLANAAYFKGRWANQFDPKDTTKEVFYTSRSNQSFVDMMHKRGTYNLAIDETLVASVLQMPYLTSNDDEKESEMSMIIILPVFKEGSVEELLNKLTVENLELALKGGMAREIDISLPKFEFEQRLELVPILRKMGISLTFNDDADFSGYSTTNRITFGDAKHVAKIKVDEEGSTAAAATVLFSFRSARPIEPTEFKCDHPFLFLIYDHTAKAILFTGIYRDPKTRT